MNSNNNKKNNHASPSSLKQQQQQLHWSPKQHITKFKVDRDFIAKKLIKTTHHHSANVSNNINKRSCDYCRKRKVKCELILDNQCSSCRKVGMECQFQVKPKKAGPPKRHHLESLEKEVEVLKQLLKEEQNKNEQLLAIATTTCSAPTTSSAVVATDDTLSTSSNDHPSNIQQQQQRQPHIVAMKNSRRYDSSDSSASCSSYSSSSSSSLASSPSSSSPSPSITSFQINTLLQQEEVENYRQFTTKELIKEIPGLTLELAERLIVEYFEFIHPNSPIIDRRSFLLQYYFEYPKPLDKQLFYAVCAVGCQYLPRHDQVSFRIVGRYLREKAMLIMNKAYRQSCITTIQTLLLVSILTPHSGSDEGVSNNWLILGAAIRMAQDLGIQADIHEDHLSASEIQTRRRLAHAIYVLDKISAASTGKPFVVKSEEFHVELPLAYEVAPPEEEKEKEHLYYYFNSSSSNNGQRRQRYHNTIPKLLQDTEKIIREKQPIFSGSFEAIRLAQMIEHVLKSLYIPKTLSSSTSSACSSPTVNDNDNNDNNDEDDKDLDTKLMTWQLNPKAWYTAKDGLEYIRILYDSLLLLRYQPLILAGPRLIKNRTEILNVCTDAASRLIGRFEAKEVWGLPILRDCMITQAAAIFLQNCNNENDTIRLQARRNLERCAKLYKRDDIVNRTRNAIILNEIVGQLSSPLEDDITTKTTTTTTTSSTTVGNNQQQLLLTCGNQLVDSYNEVLQVQQLYPNGYSSSIETNFVDPLILNNDNNILRQQQQEEEQSF